MDAWGWHQNQVEYSIDSQLKGLYSINKHVYSLAQKKDLEIYG